MIIRRLEGSMRTLLKLLALIILGPLALGLLAVLAVLTMIGIPLLFERIVATYTAPPKGGTAPS